MGSINIGTEMEAIRGASIWNNSEAKPLLNPWRDCVTIKAIGMVALFISSFKSTWPVQKINGYWRMRVHYYKFSHLMTLIIALVQGAVVLLEQITHLLESNTWWLLWQCFCFSLCLSTRLIRNYFLSAGIFYCIMRRSYYNMLWDGHEPLKTKGKMS